MPSESSESFPGTHLTSIGRENRAVTCQGGARMSHMASCQLEESQCPQCYFPLGVSCIQRTRSTFPGNCQSPVMSSSFSNLRVEKTHESPNTFHTELSILFQYVSPPNSAYYIFFLTWFAPWYCSLAYQKCFPSCWQRFPCVRKSCWKYSGENESHLGIFWAKWSEFRWGRWYVSIG